MCASLSFSRRAIDEISRFSSDNSWSILKLVIEDNSLIKLRASCPLIFSSCEVKLSLRCDIPFLCLGYKLSLRRYYFTSAEFI